MAENTILARPYAKAAFEFALSNNAIEKWAETLAFAAMITQDQSMQEILQSPNISKQKKLQAMLSICQDKLDKDSENFIKTLSENNRLVVLPEISQTFNQLKADYEKTVDVNVTSAVELNQEQLKDISSKLENKLQRKINIETSIDQQIIGGLIIRAEDLVIDGSVRGKLAKLAETLRA